MIHKYTDKEFEGLLIWCLAHAIDDLECVVEAYDPHKGLAQLNEKEFIIANADMCLSMICGQLSDMGVDMDKLKSLTKKNDVETESAKNFITTK